MTQNSKDAKVRASIKEMGQQTNNYQTGNVPFPNQSPVQEELNWDNPSTYTNQPYGQNMQQNSPMDQVQQQIQQLQDLPQPGAQYNQPMNQGFNQNFNQHDFMAQNPQTQMNMQNPWADQAQFQQNVPNYQQPMNQGFNQNFNQQFQQQGNDELSGLDNLLKQINSNPKAYQNEVRSIDLPDGVYTGVIESAIYKTSNAGNLMVELKYHLTYNNLAAMTIDANQWHHLVLSGPTVTEASTIRSLKILNDIFLGKGISIEMIGGLRTVLPQIDRYLNGSRVELKIENWTSKTSKNDDGTPKTGKNITINSIG